MELVYTRTITSDEMEILENDLIDVKQWIDLAIDGKINNCKKRIEKHIVANEDISALSQANPDLVKAYLTKPGRKNRKQRDEDEKKKK